MSLCALRVDILASDLLAYFDICLAYNGRTDQSSRVRGGLPFHIVAQNHGPAALFVTVLRPHGEPGPVGIAPTCEVAPSSLTGSETAAGSIADGASANAMTATRKVGLIRNSFQLTAES